MVRALGSTRTARVPAAAIFTMRGAGSRLPGTLHTTEVWSLDAQDKHPTSLHSGSDAMKFSLSKEQNLLTGLTVELCNLEG